MKNVGEKIKEIRISKGFSQEELATQSQVNVRTIQRIEKQENMPHGKTLQMICETLGIQAEDVLEFNQAEDSTMISWMYFSIISGMALPLGNILLPLILWLTNKSKVKDGDRIGRHLVYNQVIISILTFMVLVTSFFLRINHIYYDLSTISLYLFFVLNGLNYSLNSTLYPADNNYYFYLHDAEGNIYYARNAEEHKQNRWKAYGE